MTYIPAAGVSTHDFSENHRTAIMAIAEGDADLRTTVAYELADMGLARVAQHQDYGATVLTNRGRAMVAYLRERGED